MKRNLKNLMAGYAFMTGHPGKASFHGTGLRTASGME